MDGVPSPCVKICQYDPARGVCAGCYRVLDEIARWSGMADGERRETLARCAVRRAKDEAARRV